MNTLLLSAALLLPAGGPTEFRHNGLPPEQAAAAMTVPDGFEVRLFAGEPDVHQPVAMCLDDRGRVWVAEAHTYPRRHPHPGPVLPDAEKANGDRIVVFEDTDGDGKHDKKTVVVEGLNLVSGIEVGFGGVWVGAAPYLLFIPLDAATDKPTGGPQILLDGWGHQDTHETLNSLTWGPDGWLYGCHGVFTHSKVGKPGTPDKDRTPINAGVWRYHPTRHTFEVFAHGTSNPWGLDYNAVGDFFVSACVIPHLYHVVQGGRYQRQAGQHFNPYTYADIPTIADHLHWQGASPWAGNAISGDKGGGHAHCGLMCYQGGTWPKEYHGKMFMGNIHGRRINVDVLAPKGSGYTASHGRDFLMANDSWARFINLKSGPDGNVYLIDWYDKQACHNNDSKSWDRSNGRVYKIVYKGAKPVTGVDLAKCSDEELVNYQLHDNEWYVRHARRLLQERMTTVSREAKPSAAVREGLEAIAKNPNLGRAGFDGVNARKPDPVRRLRALWALYSTDLLTRTMLADSLFDPSEHVSGWALMWAVAAGEWFTEGPCVTTEGNILSRAHPVAVRYILSGLLQRPPAKITGVALGLLSGASSPTDDPLLARLFWYALEPYVAAHPDSGLAVPTDPVSPFLLELAARRVAAVGTPEAFAALVKHLSDASTDDARLSLLRGTLDGLKGRRDTPMPTTWPALYAKLSASPSGDIRATARAVAVAFGDPTAFAQLRATAADRTGDPAARQAAVGTLADARDKELPPVLRELLAEPAVRAAALRGLAAFDDPGTPAAVLAAYPAFAPADRRAAVATLSTRPAFARALLDAIAAKTVPAADVPAETIRQLRAFRDPGLDARVAAVWGTVRDTPADRKKLIADWAKKLGGPAPGAPDLGLGRAVFAKNCQQCHTLYAVGGKVGPDITGANRGDLGYLLENVFDPSAVIPREYAATTLALADGRTISGIVKEETKTALTVVTPTETLTLPAADVEKRTPSDKSMMPDDVTAQIPEADLRALFAYLRHPAQVPILATPDNAPEFFNGKDLAGWDGDKELWKVENGEIIGKTATGIKRNTFLKSTMEVTDFRLAVKVKLVPDSGNSGIQFRSAPLPDGEMRGPQADVGAGWWGKLYEESARGMLVATGAGSHVKPGDWNEYVIEAKGSRVKMSLNGHECVDLDDPKISRRGVIAFQIHSGGPMEVRFKDLRFAVLK